jgi:flavin-binding protein dodecin
MAILKVIEIMADSSKSWEDAAAKGIVKASNTLKVIKSAYLKEQRVTVGSGGKINTYRVTLKISIEVS